MSSSAVPSKRIELSSLQKPLVFKVGNFYCATQPPDVLQLCDLISPFCRSNTPGAVGKKQPLHGKNMSDQPHSQSPKTCPIFNKIPLHTLVRGLGHITGLVDKRKASVA